MCIAVIILNYSKRFPLLVAHNREEDIYRETSPLEQRGDVLAAYDIKAGGIAAVGLNIRTGTFAVLTNCRIKGSYLSSGESRGKFILEILEEWIPRVEGRVFQGYFHCLKGNAFGNEPKRIEYFTNLNCNLYPGEDLVDNRELKIIVVMNQHPLCENDWTSKLLYVKNALSGRLQASSSIESGSELCDLVVSELSRTGFVLPSLNSECMWSPDPEAEKILQRCIMVPPTLVRGGNDYVFGTISQTVFVSDTVERSVLYRYRETVDLATRSTKFGHWSDRIISF